MIMRLYFMPLQWRHNEPDGVSSHQPHDCLLNRLFGGDQRKHQSSASLAFVRGIHRWPVNSPHKGPVTRKMFPFDDVIMLSAIFAFQVRLGVHEICLFPVYAVSWFLVFHSLRTRVKWKPFITPLGNTVVRSWHNWTNIQHLVCAEGAQLCRIVSILILLFIWNYCKVCGGLFIVNSKAGAHDDITGHRWIPHTKANAIAHIMTLL